MKKRILQFLLFLLLVLLAAGIYLYFRGEALAKDWLEQEFSEALGRPVSIPGSLVFSVGKQLELSVASIELLKRKKFTQHMSLSDVRVSLPRYPRSLRDVNVSIGTATLSLLELDDESDSEKSSDATDSNKSVFAVDEIPCVDIPELPNIDIDTFDLEFIRDAQSTRYTFKSDKLSLREPMGEDQTLVLHGLLSKENAPLQIPVVLEGTSKRGNTLVASVRYGTEEGRQNFIATEIKQTRKKSGRCELQLSIRSAIENVEQLNRLYPFELSPQFTASLDATLTLSDSAQLTINKASLGNTTVSGSLENRGSEITADLQFPLLRLSDFDNISAKSDLQEAEPSETRGAQTITETSLREALAKVPTISATLHADRIEFTNGSSLDDVRVKLRNASEEVQLVIDSSEPLSLDVQLSLQEEMLLTIKEATLGQSSAAGTLRYHDEEVSADLTFPRISVKDFDRFSSPSAPKEAQQAEAATSSSELLPLARLKELPILEARLQSDVVELADGSQLANIKAKLDSNAQAIHLKVDSLQTLEGGLTADFSVLGLQQTPEARLSLRAKDLTLRSENGEEVSLPATAVAAELVARGNSVKALRASLNGAIESVTSAGKTRLSKFSFLLHGITDILSPVLGQRKNQQLRCIVQRVHFKNGEGTFEPLLVHASKVAFFGEGSMSLIDDSVTVNVSMQTDEPSISSLLVPFKVRGPFNNIAVYPNAEATAMEVITAPFSVAELAGRSLKSTAHSLFGDSDALSGPCAEALTKLTLLAENPGPAVEQVEESSETKAPKANASELSTVPQDVSQNVSPKLSAEKEVASDVVPRAATASESGENTENEKKAVETEAN